MTRRFFVKLAAAVLPGWRFIDGQYVDVETELQAAAIRGEREGTEDHWVAGDAFEEMAPFAERARFEPIVGVDGVIMPERARFV